VPLAAADYARLREAVALRGPAAAPVGRATLARRLVAGSLDRAVDVAAALELRGYGRGAPARASSRPGGRHSWRFAGCGLLLVAAAVATRIGGLGGFGSYPTINLDLDSLTLALAAALPLAVALPYAGLDRGGERRHPCG
jgi:energy-coupling factor transport system permease protein